MIQVDNGKKTRKDGAKGQKHCQDKETKSFSRHDYHTKTMPQKKFLGNGAKRSIRNSKFKKMIVQPENG
jgi:translation initiation factor IF-3